MDRYRGRSPPSRDRPPIRPRDDHPDVEYFGQGESYRPGGSTGEGPYRPAHRERGTDTWNTDRRDDRRREDVDSYIPSQRPPRSRSPSNFRRRSRSPYARSKELFPDRARSPSRRFSPRRDDRDRSPTRKRSRSPGYMRTHSPEPRRGRDNSSDGRRSPKRERLSSPYGRYDRARSPPRRTYSPSRDADRNVYRTRSRSPGFPTRPRPSHVDENNWRRRSPSPRASGPGSNVTSRRSSPRAHPDRNSLAGSVPRSPIPQSRYDNSNYRPRSPISNYGERSANPTPPPASRELNAAPPTGPASQRGTYDRPPPTGPARPYASPSGQQPPTGPASHTPSSVHNRGPGPTSINPPSQPRGAGPGRFNSLQRDFSTSPLRGRGSLTYRAPGARPSTYQESAPPSGPRATTFGAPRGDFGSGSRGTYSNYGRGDHSYSASFRPNNSNSTTYPRTQRFNSATPVNSTQTHLGTLEKIIPGGKKLPSGINPDVERRLQSLNTDADKLRSIIEEKQKLKREAINEWEVRERESAREALRSELAEEALAKLMDGEDSSGGAAF